MDQRHELFAKLWFADRRPESSGGLLQAESRESRRIPPGLRTRAAPAATSL